jgi:hypothetical protein
LRSVSAYISKFIYHMYDTTPPQDWDKVFSSATKLLTAVFTFLILSITSLFPFLTFFYYFIQVLTNLPGELQVSANFKLVDILGVLYRKGALLPFLKEVMPMVWESIEV